MFCCSTAAQIHFICIKYYSFRRTKCIWYIHTVGICIFIVFFVWQTRMPNISYIFYCWNRYWITSSARPGGNISTTWLFIGIFIQHIWTKARMAMETELQKRFSWNGYTYPGVSKQKTQTLQLNNAIFARFIWLYLNFQFDLISVLSVSIRSNQSHVWVDLLSIRSLKTSVS